MNTDTKSGNDCQCERCGETGLGLGWPSPRLCGKCDRHDKMTFAGPCPFCGVTACWGVKDDKEFWIECAVCHATGPKVQLEGLAIYHWNRRMLPTVESENLRRQRLAKFKTTTKKETTP